MKKIIIMATFLLFLITGQVMAKDISFETGLTQDAFKELSKEAAAALSYKNMAPAEPLGITGFDIGLESSFISITTGDNNYWEKAFANEAPSMIPIPRIRVRKGLPAGIDIGAMYASMPGSNIKLYGAEVSYAILKGGIAKPALGLRGTFTKLSGVEDLDYETTGFDISISKGFAIITPYAGAGMIYFNSEAKGNLQSLSTALIGSPLNNENKWQPRYFGGLKISPSPFFGIIAEVEYLNRPAYSIRIALEF